MLKFKQNRLGVIFFIQFSALFWILQVVHNREGWPSIARPQSSALSTELRRCAPSPRVLGLSLPFPRSFWRIFVQICPRRGETKLLHLLFIYFTTFFAFSFSLYFYFFILCCNFYFSFLFLFTFHYLCITFYYL